jgi:hypothetical protein
VARWADIVEADPVEVPEAVTVEQVERLVVAGVTDQAARDALASLGADLFVVMGGGYEPTPELLAHTLSDIESWQRAIARWSEPR